MGMSTYNISVNENPIAEGRVALVYPWADGRIIKLARDWVPRDWVEYEFRIARIVQATGLRVPWAYEIVEVDGIAGIVYERLDGPTMLDEIGTSPHKAGVFGKSMGRLHAEMHDRTGTADLPENTDRLKRKIESVNGAPENYRHTALRALAELPAGTSLLHGDFHPGNILLTGEGPVTIDWPDASRGHPLADVARTVVLAKMGGMPANPALRLLVSVLRRVFTRAYLSAYFRQAPYKKQELSQWLYPVLFARLSENIESERAVSVQWLDQLLPKIPHS